jgi:hypothetical protein
MTWGSKSQERRAGSVRVVTPARPFDSAGAARNRSGGFIQEVYDIDGEAAAFAGALGFPIEEVKAPVAGLIDDDKVAFAPRFLGLLLPLTALILLGAQDESTEIRCSVAIRQMLGRTASIAAAGRAKDADARLRVGKPEGVPIPRFAQHRLRMKIGQLVAVHSCIFSPG